MNTYREIIEVENFKIGDTVNLNDNTARKGFVVGIMRPFSKKESECGDFLYLISGYRVTFFEDGDFHDKLGLDKSISNSKVVLIEIYHDSIINKKLYLED